MNTKIKGDFGEGIAAKYLALKGYKIMERNFRTRTGEIDIIAEKNNELVIVEVKTRKNKRFGDPKEAVNKYKIRHIINTAEFYIYSKNLYDMPVRFDIIEVFTDKLRINHIKEAFSESDT